MKHDTRQVMKERLRNIKADCEMVDGVPMFVAIFSPDKSSGPAHTFSIFGTKDLKVVATALRDFAAMIENAKG